VQKVVQKVSEVVKICQLAPRYRRCIGSECRWDIIQYLLFAPLVTIPYHSTQCPHVLTGLCCQWVLSLVMRQQLDYGAQELPNIICGGRLIIQVHQGTFERAACK
jgi:hypothetical protein